MFVYANKMTTMMMINIVGSNNSTVDL